MTTEFLQLSHHFYNLFQALPSEAKRDFLESLVANNREEIEDSLFYQACKTAREGGFLSDDEAQDFLASLPQ